MVFVFICSQNSPPEISPSSPTTLTSTTTNGTYTTATTSIMGYEGREEVQIFPSKQCSTKRQWLAAIAGTFQ